MDGTVRETIISSNLDTPHGITIDQNEGRIYWTDLGPGIFYRIESANLDGSDRKIILYQTYQTPFSIAVTKEKILWTDTRNKALWGIRKNLEGATPEKIRTYNESPRDIYQKMSIENIPQCQNVKSAINKNKKLIEQFDIAADSLQCLNLGELINNRCRCPRGYTGTRCEINLCHNYCFVGECLITTDGYPNCKCPQEFSGERCETKIQKNHCLNGGTYRIEYINGKKETFCECPYGFSGVQCENQICKDFCINGECKIQIKDGKAIPSCDCAKGFSGDRCQIEICKSNCLNNGKCNTQLINDTLHPICDCPPGFSGSRCEIQVCKNYCFNEGVCKIQVENQNNIVQCECPQGFTGNQCEIKTELESDCTVICEEGEEFGFIDTTGKRCR